MDSERATDLHSLRTSTVAGMGAVRAQVWFTRREVHLRSGTGNCMAVAVLAEMWLGPCSRPRRGIRKYHAEADGDIDLVTA